ncbi:MAG TPA: tetratricopeptide repeat protein [Bryobacteraceae bacterium]|nr:tetratricopeptide repeat protein [Bryobacteraceae bacterium]
MRTPALLWLFVAASVVAAGGELESARDRQDRPALEAIVAKAGSAAEKAPGDAARQYQAALASSYLAEVALELRDKALAQRAAEAGIRTAERAVSLKPDKAEYHRVLGTLCGQVIPANVLAGLSYGKRARDAVNKALELDPKSSGAWLARGVGNYYLPAAFGGGPALAVADFRKALQLNPASADAWLWLGLGLRKEKNNAEARKAFTKALQLNPSRVWAKQQLEKTPPQ